MSDDLRISRDKILNYCKYNNAGHLTGYLVIEALTSAMSHEELSEWLKDIGWDDKEAKEDFECYIVFEGKKLPITEVCAHWESQMDRLIREKALELFEDEKLSKLDHVTHELTEGIKKKAAEELGITIEEEW